MTSLHRSGLAAVPSRGRRAGWALTGTLRFASRVLRGLIATTVLLALVAGLPWALWHYIGWPLPDHVPAGDDVHAVLMAPMTPQFLLDVLACVLWLLWARFTFDVLAAVLEAVRTAPWPHPAGMFAGGPLHAAASVLVSAILFSIVSSRTSIRTTSVPAGFAASGPVPVASTPGHVVATAALHTQGGVRPIGPETETVQPPERGVHDSLWRIAQRRLGDGNRWPEIWTLNQGNRQRDGRVFTNPNLILPFWELRIPAIATENTPELPIAAQPVPPEPSPRQHDPDDEHAPSTRVPAHKEPTAADTVQHPAEGGTTISTSTGAYVGLGLAALITVALITVRLRRRRRYRPGLPEPDDPTRAPIVRALRIAHDSLTLAQPDDLVAGRADRLPELDTRDRAQDTVRTVLPGSDDTVLGVHNGHTVALNLARSKGLGLIGPGAHAAARALIVTLLAHALADDSRDTVVVVPVADAQALLGADLPPQSPARLRIVDDLSAALDTVEAELLSRARLLAKTELDNSSDHHSARTALLVLVASPTPDTERRIQAILDNGSTVGLTGILLGQWRPGGTARVRDDGTVGATSPDLAENLTDTRLFTLPGADAADLLTLLHDAAPRSEAPDVANEPARASSTAGKELKATTEDTYDFVIADAAEPERGIALKPSPPIASVVIDIPARSSTARTQQPDLGQTVSQAAAPSPVDQNDTIQQRHVELIDGPTEQRSPSSQAPITVETPREPEHPALHLEVLGRLHLRRTEPDHADIIEAFAPRQREILTYLALHPNGVRKETLTAAIWPDAHPDRPFNTFHATLSQLRAALRKATGNSIATVVINDDGHYGLDRSQVTVDLWRLQHALTARRQAPNTPQRVAALRQVAELYRGDLADGLAAEWIDAPREALRRDVLDALSALIRAVGEADPEHMLGLLEQARNMDPYNEAIYRDLMRVQARLGQHDSIPRTLRLLTTSLAELDQQPTHDTLALADLLRRPRPAQRHDKEAS